MFVCLTVDRRSEAGSIEELSDSRLYLFLLFVSVWEVGLAAKVFQHDKLRVWELNKETIDALVDIDLSLVIDSVRVVQIIVLISIWVHSQVHSVELVDELTVITLCFGGKIVHDPVCGDTDTVRVT